MCEKTVVSAPLCPTGYTYNVNTQTCTLVETSIANCLKHFSTLTGVTRGVTRGSDNVIFFLTQTPSQVKCLAEQSQWCAFSGSSLQTQSLPLQTGQQLYNNGSPYTATESFLIEDINNVQKIVVKGGCRGAIIPNTAAVVNINLGIIQTITLLTSLPNC
jgi:hypothetical protein